MIPMNVFETMIPQILGGSAIVTMGIGIGFLLTKFLQIFGTYKMFQKSGEAGWKALIPFYCAYTRFNLYWDKKFFWVYLVLFLASSYLSYAAGGAAGAVSAAVSLALIITTVKINLYNARSFGMNGGMAVLLLLMPWLGYSILGLGYAEFLGKQMKNN